MLEDWARIKPMQQTHKMFRVLFPEWNNLIQLRADWLSGHGVKADTQLNLRSQCALITYEANYYTYWAKSCSLIDQRSLLFTSII